MSSRYSTCSRTYICITIYILSEFLIIVTISTWSEGLERSNRTAYTYSITFFFLSLLGNKNIPLSILQNTDSSYFSYIQRKGQDFPCLKNERQRKYFCECRRALVVLHRTTLSNHRCKVDCTAELPLPKASQAGDRIRDKPPQNTEQDAVHTEPTPRTSSGPQWDAAHFLLPKASLLYFQVSA